MTRFIIILIATFMSGIVSWLIGQVFGLIVQIIVTLPLAIAFGIAGADPCR